MTEDGKHIVDCECPHGSLETVLVGGEGLLRSATQPYRNDREGAIRQGRWSRRSDGSPTGPIGSVLATHPLTAKCFGWLTHELLEASAAPTCSIPPFVPGDLLTPSIGSAR